MRVFFQTRNAGFISIKAFTTWTTPWNSDATELERFHASYLNSGYHPAVLKRWKESGVMEIVQRRLGARLVVTAVDLPPQGHAGEKINIRLTIANHGFASLYNPRPVALVLISPEGARHRFPIPVDPRLWKAGETAEVKTEVTLPGNLTPGNHTWALHLPDASERLAPDARFSIRLANKDAWDAKTGENRLVTHWPIVALPSPLTMKTGH